MKPKTNTSTTNILQDLLGVHYSDTVQKQDSKMETKDLDEKVKNIALEIERVKAQSGLSYIEATVEVCERQDLEIENMKKVLPKNIKEKIELEASKLNLLKYRVNTLI